MHGSLTMNHPGSGIMRLLKESTAALHESAEQHELQKILVHGAVDRNLYIQFLGQMWHVHAVLEDSLRRVGDESEWSRVVQPHHFRCSLICEDLRHFGADEAAIPPMAGARDVVERIAATMLEEPAGLLGYLYVLEGSTNGSRFMARNVERSLGLPGGSGTSYLDPHGDRLRERWANFRSDMDGLEFSAGQMEAMVQSARLMFEGMIRISGDLMQQGAVTLPC